MRIKKQRYDSEFYPGTEFHNIQIEKACGLLSSEGSRSFLDGNFSLNHVKSNKFGEQIQFQVFTDQPPTVQEASGSGKWHRVEIYLSAKLIDSLIHALEKIKEEKDERA